MKHRLQKGLVFSFLLLIVLQQVNAQLELATHFMRDLPQSSRSNPAFFVQDEITISLPSFYGGFYNSNFKPSEALTHENNLFTLNLEGLENAVENSGIHFQNNLHLETLAINYQKDDWRLDLSQSFRQINELQTSAEATNFLLQGNGAFLDEQISLDATNDLLLYNEIGLGFGYKMVSGISIGLRVKYLSGIANMQTEETGLKVITNSNDFSIESSGSHLINTAGLFERTGDETQAINSFKLSDSFFGNSNGFGFDVGLDFDVSENFQIAASIQNVGIINWRENTTQFSASGNRIFDSSVPGVNGEVGINLSSLSDSLQQVLGFVEQEIEYSSKLPMSIYLSGLYKTNTGLNLGLLYGYASFAENESHYAAVHLNKKIGKNLSLGTQYSFRVDEHHGVGLNAVLDFKGVQVYFLTDNVLPVFNILEGKYYNARIGINIGLNGKARKNLDLLGIDDKDPSSQSEEEVVVIEKPTPQVTPKEDTELPVKNNEAKLAKEKRKELKANNKLAKARLKEKRLEEKRKAAADAKALAAEAAAREALAAEAAAREALAAEAAAKKVLDAENAAADEKAMADEKAAAQKALDAENATADEKAMADEKAGAEAGSLEAEKATQDELLRRREAMERQAQADAERKQRETEARLLAERNRKMEEQRRIQAQQEAERNRIAEEQRRQNQTTVVTPNSSGSSLGRKTLTDKTSLRQAADSKSKVMLRFNPGDSVEVLEKTNLYWWKVLYKGQIGWVKARLLK